MVNKFNGLFLIYNSREDFFKGLLYFFLNLLRFETPYPCRHHFVRYYKQECFLRKRYKLYPKSVPLKSRDLVLLRRHLLHLSHQYPQKVVFHKLPLGHGEHWWSWRVGFFQFQKYERLVADCEQYKILDSLLGLDGLDGLFALVLLDDDLSGRQEVNIEGLQLVRDLENVFGSQLSQKGWVVHFSVFQNPNSLSKQYYKCNRHIQPIIVESF